MLESEKHTPMIPEPQQEENVDQSAYDNDSTSGRPKTARPAPPRVQSNVKTVAKVDVPVVEK
jgi:hypothetical protein